MLAVSFGCSRSRLILYVRSLARSLVYNFSPPGRPVLKANGRLSLEALQVFQLSRYCRCLLISGRCELLHSAEKRTIAFSSSRIGAQKTLTGPIFGQPAASPSWRLLTDANKQQVKLQLRLWSVWRAQTGRARHNVSLGPGSRNSLSFGRFSSFLWRPRNNSNLKLLGVEISRADSVSSELQAGWWPVRPECWLCLLLTFGLAQAQATRDLWDWKVAPWARTRHL